MRLVVLALTLLTISPVVAANAEVTDCTVITTLPIVIQTRGIWCLKGNLSWSGTGGRAIDVRESFVTIDLNGFLLNGLGLVMVRRIDFLYAGDNRSALAPAQTIWTFVAVLLWTPVIVLGTATSLVAGACLLAAIHLARRVDWHDVWPRVLARLDRWRRWEFWPSAILYAPVALHIARLALRHGGVGTLSAANPGIPEGGFVGESKFAILAQLPERWTLRSSLIEEGGVEARLEDLRRLIEFEEQTFPVVLKPDAGQRGVGVRLVQSFDEAQTYFRQQPGAAVVQRYHRGPFEAGIFYYRRPGDARGRIFSITDKEFPVITGDGHSTLEELIWAHPRYRLQASVFLQRHEAELAHVLAAGERFRLAIAGNHAQGTLFRDGGHLLTPALERRSPLRFVWQIDAEGRFTLATDEFAEVARQVARKKKVPLNDLRKASGFEIADRVRGVLAALRAIEQEAGARGSRRLGGCRGRGACLRGLGGNGGRHHARGARLAVEISQSEAGQHEDDRRAGGEPAHEALAAGGAENGLAGAGAERRADLGALAGLQQHEPHDPATGQDVDDDQERVHHSPRAAAPARAVFRTMAMKPGALRLAPPTSTPSISGSAASASALSAFTLPP